MATNASVELYQAEKSLRKAQSAWDLKRDAAEAEHLAYVSQRQVEIARVAAERRLAEAEASKLGEERERVLLAARTREVEHEHELAQQRAREAEEARIEAERRAGEAEQARQEAEARAQEAERANQAAAEAAQRAAELERKLKEIGAKETSRGLVLTIGDVLFDVNRAELKPGVLRNLYQLATFMRENSERKLLVEGHTDSTGEDAYNLSLSEQRAEAVRAFLIENGIAEERIQARGYGEVYPVATNGTAEGRQRNRRVEVVVLREGESFEAQARR